MVAEMPILDFTELYRQNYRSLRHYLLRYTGDIETAEELVQEAFMKAFVKIDEFDQSRSFKNWLYQIAKRKALDYLERKKLERKTSLTYEADLNNITPEDEFFFSEDRQQFQDFLEHCGYQSGVEALLLRLQGYSYKEIGKRLNINKNTLATRLHRIKFELEEEFGI